MPRESSLSIYFSSISSFTFSLTRPMLSVSRVIFQRLLMYIQENMYIYHCHLMHNDQAPYKLLFTLLCSFKSFPYEQLESSLIIFFTVCRISLCRYTTVYLNVSLLTERFFSVFFHEHCSGHSSLHLCVSTSEEQIHRCSFDKYSKTFKG